jgi:Na+/H+-translocating membrane pyrophosphatase
LLSRVGRAASRVEVQVSEEVQRQFRDVAGVRTGEVRADYARASDAATRGAVRASLWPLLAGVLLPVLLGIGLRYAFGGEGNEGWLAGAGLLVGVVLAAAVVAAGTLGTFARAAAARAYAETAPGSVAEGVSPPPDADLVTAARTAERWAAHGVQCSAPIVAGAARLSIAVALVLVPLMAG